MTTRNSKRIVNLADSFGITKIGSLIEKAEEENAPCLFLSPLIAVKSYRTIQKYMPTAEIYFAVKSCPVDFMLESLHKAGSCFDVASVGEIKRLLKLGVPGSKMSFGNTIKKADTIKFAYDSGIRLFVSDDFDDMSIIAKLAPGSKVNIRIVMNSNDANMSFNDKFGAYPDKAVNLAIHAKSLGLIPYGISFHVGSQQTKTSNWEEALAKVGNMMTILEDEHGITFECINLGGGLPVQYTKKVDTLYYYCTKIMELVENKFDNIKIMIEPGRSIAATSGLMVGEVIRSSSKDTEDNDYWTFFNVGKYNGLDELSHYIDIPIYYTGIINKVTEELTRGIAWHEDQYVDSRKTYLSSVAGPTCCPYDRSPEDMQYRIPNDIKIGEYVLFLNVGAYTASIESNFNSFEKIRIFNFDEVTKKKN